MLIFESKYNVGDEVWFIRPHVEKTKDDDGFNHLVRRPIVCSGKISKVNINLYTPLTYIVSYNHPLTSEFLQLTGVSESDLYPSREEAVKAVEAEGLKVYEEGDED